MSDRERERERPRTPRDPGAGTPPEDASTAPLRDAADRFLRHADQAIERALSGDSETFLRANRQQGGQ